MLPSFKNAVMNLAKVFYINVLNLLHACVDTQSGLGGERGGRRRRAGGRADAGKVENLKFLKKFVH